MTGRAPTIATTVALMLTGASLATAQDATDIILLELTERNGVITVTGTPIPVTDRPGYDNQPAFTSDGRAILYTSIRDDQADTYRYDIATGRSAQLTRTPESEYSPTPKPGRDRFSVVRVEADSTQRLWSFDHPGGDPTLLLEHVAPVGYHAWVGPQTVALYILGEPATLQIVDVRTGYARVVATDIGRSLQAVPGRDRVTFTQRTRRDAGDDLGRWWLREVDAVTGETRDVAPLLGEDSYHVWTPAGSLLTAHGSRIFQLDERGEWRQVFDLADAGIGPLSRLAVSPDGSYLAVVAERGG